LNARLTLLPLLVIAAALALGATACPKTAKSGLPMIPMLIEDHKVWAELAANDAQRARGLMYRRSMKPNRGMLFVYPRKERLSFWMKNTFLPLTIAFLDDDGTIVHLEDMAPQTTAGHRTPKAVKYALEMNRGWFAERGIEVGHRAWFELPDDLVVQ